MFPGRLRTGQWCTFKLPEKIEVIQPMTESQMLGREPLSSPKFVMRDWLIAENAWQPVPDLFVGVFHPASLGSDRIRNADGTVHEPLGLPDSITPVKVTHEDVGGGCFHVVGPNLTILTVRFSPQSVLELAPLVDREHLPPATLARLLKDNPNWQPRP